MNKKFLPLTGSEAIFSVYPWNKGVNSDNCYDYAIGDFEVGRRVKSTPGDRAGLSANGLNFTTCKGIKKRILSDNPKTVYQIRNASAPCRSGFYKIMNFVSPQGDFHFYKQVRGVKYKVKPGDTCEKIAKFLRVSPGTVKKAGVLKVGKTLTVPANLWAHKQGWGQVPIIIDAKGLTIYDHRKANRNYPGLNYSTFCSAYCVKKDKAASGKNSKPGLAIKKRLKA